MSTYYSPSGGTTGGLPRYIPCDVRENHRQRARLARRLRRSGMLGPQNVALNLFSAARMYRSLEIFNEFCERCGTTVLPLSSHASDTEILEHAARFGADTVLGMPSRLLALARTAAGRGVRLPQVIFGGEFLHAGMRQALRDSFGAEHFAAIYGSAETGIVAYDPDGSGVYRFPRDIAEVTVEEGALLITNLVRRRWPVVRYNTQDMGRIVSESGDEVYVELQGRATDSFLIGGEYFGLADFRPVLARFSDYQIQLRYEDRDAIRFCVVAETPDTTLERRLRDVLEADDALFSTEVAYVRAGDLVRLPSGKTPRLIDTRGR